LTIATTLKTPARSAVTQLQPHSPTDIADINSCSHVSFADPFRASTPSSRERRASLGNGLNDYSGDDPCI
jgi:hypothetical protein